MIYFYISGIGFLVFFALFVWSMCAAAGQADEAIERIFQDQIKNGGLSHE